MKQERLRPAVGYAPIASHKRTWLHVAEAAENSGRCKKGPLFDHLVGYREQLVREFETECLRGLDVDHELEFGRL
jgi:hypothetical protein